MSEFFKNSFTVISLVFFTRILDFESLSSPSEGLSRTSEIIAGNPLAPFLSLMQHSIFLIVVGLLFIKSQKTIQTLIKGKIIWILLILVFCSFLWSGNPEFSFRGIFALIESCAFGLYFAANYNIQQQLRLVAWALGIASLITIVYTLALPSYGIESGIHLGAWRGPFIQKNILARLLVLSCLIYISINTKRGWNDFLILIALCIAVGLMVLSQSKTALIVITLLLIIKIIFQSLFIRDIAAIPVIMSLFLFFGSTAFAVVNNAENILNNIGKDLTLSGRTVIWTSLIEQIKLHPWLGYGYMGFWSNSETRYIMTKLFGTTYTPTHSHNGYLELIISFGFVGALLFMITFIAIARRAFILMRWNKTSEGLWPLLFLSFLLIYNFSEPTLIQHNSIYWIIYFSMTLTRFIDIKEFESISSKE